MMMTKTAIVKVILTMTILNKIIKIAMIKELFIRIIILGKAMMKIKDHNSRS